MIKSEVYYDNTGIYVTDLETYNYTDRQRQIIENKVANKIVSEFRTSLFKTDKVIAEVLIPSPRELDMGISQIQIFV